MSNQLHYNTLSLNDDTKSCIIDGNEVNLTKREYQLLKFFLENPNYIYTRKELIEKFWDHKGSERAVDSTISRLRKNIKQYGSNIVTKISYGYYFKTE